MGTVDRELGWEDTIQDDGKEFVLLPEGDYDFTIDHFERARSKGSDKLPPCNMALVFFTIHNPHGEDATVRESFLLHTKMEWKLSELFCGIGLKKKGEELRMNWNMVPGAKGRCKVIVEPDRNDPNKKYNHIKEIYPYEPKSFSGASTGGFKKWN